MISRRAVLAGVGAASCGGARAQAPGRIYQIGSLHLAPRDAPQHVALLAELARLGFVEGRNIALDPQGYAMRWGDFPAHAARLAAAKVDAIYVGGDAGVRAAAAATGTIPILGVTDDIVGSGFARSLSNPGRNVTGVSILAPVLDGKRLELLMELLPGARTLAALGDATLKDEGVALRRIAQARGVDLHVLTVKTPDDIGPAIEAARAKGAEAINVLATPLLFNNERIIFDASRRLRLPTMHQWPDSARLGGLAGYGPNMPDVYRTQVARIMARLLNGVSPADIPIEQPTRFEFVVNRRIAALLGVEPPESILARADEVIE
jgi:putative ABC transport system substrate-binding protein